MGVNYPELAAQYLRIAQQVAEALRADKDTIACAVLGSVARGDVHLKSDIDLLVLVEGTGIYRWTRRVVQGVVVNAALRSLDVLERMSQDHPDTILALREAVLLYDPRDILRPLQARATLSAAVAEELLRDLLDEARSFIGKAKRALDEGDLESSLLCLRQGAMRLTEMMFYREKGRRINPLRFWREIRSLSSPAGLAELFATIHGLQAVREAQLAEMLERLERFLPQPAEVTRGDVER